jgi:hypothetical protein
MSQATLPETSPRQVSLRREQPLDREVVANRLLVASAEHSFDPLIEIDWDAPLAPDTFFMPAHRVSLYGTPLWEQMSREQRVDLSRHEVACLASVGIWFEVILMGLLARHVYDEDLTSAHTQYAFTELADECRHSTMFGKLVTKLDTPAYGVGRKLHNLARVMFHAPMGASSWTAILVAEEILDTFQREAMNDESVQPVVQAVNRIHVVEEARHVRYAREELQRVVARTSPVRMHFERTRTAMIAYQVASHLIHPKVYAAVGLDPVEARRQANASEARAETLRWSAQRLVGFLREVGLIAGPTEHLWRKAHLV